MNLDPFVVEDFEHYFILYKPQGWFVHPPEDHRALKQFRKQILTSWLKEKFPFRCHPVHRLDFATEGLLIWAKSSEAAGVLSRHNSDGLIEKNYEAVSRGFVEPEAGVIEIPLLSDSSPLSVPCKTEYKTRQRLEVLNSRIYTQYPHTRYSYLEIRLHTGRWHQIRRHFNRISHPLVGDREHGDSHHNRFFRDTLKISGLLLRAQRLQFEDPWSGRSRTFVSPLTPRWGSVLDLFNKNVFDCDAHS